MQEALQRQGLNTGMERLMGVRVQVTVQVAAQAVVVVLASRARGGTMTR